LLRTNIYLEAAQAERLDRLAAQEGTSRAELIRRLLDRALSGGMRLEHDLAAIDASFGSLIDIEVTPRHGDDRAAHSRRCGGLDRDPGRLRRADRAPTRAAAGTGMAPRCTDAYRAAGR